MYKGYALGDGMASCDLSSIPAVYGQYSEDGTSSSLCALSDFKKCLF